MSYWAKQLENGKYQLCVKMTDDGKRFEKRKIVEAPNETVAKKRAKEFYEDILTKRIVHTPNAIKAITVEQFANDHLEFLKTKKRENSTIDLYRRSYCVYVNRICGNQPIALVDENDVERIAASLSDLSPAVRNYTLKFFETLTKRAMKKKLRASPVDISDFLLRQTKSEIVIWRPEEKTKMIEAAASLGLLHEGMITIGLNCGLRIAEICALKKTDVSFEKSDKYPLGCLTVARTYSDAATSPDKTQLPKAKRIAKVPLNQKSRSMFQKLILRAGNSVWLFGDKRKRECKTPYLDSARLAYMFDRISLKAFGTRSHNTHIMRHTAISDYYRVTGNLVLTMKFARHADIKQTMRYVHTDEKDVAAGVIAMAAAM